MSGNTDNSYITVSFRTAAIYLVAFFVLSNLYDVLFSLNILRLKVNRGDLFTNFLLGVQIEELIVEMREVLYGFI